MKYADESGETNSSIYLAKNMKGFDTRVLELVLRRRFFAMIIDQDKTLIDQQYLGKLRLTGNLTTTMDNDIK